MPGGCRTVSESSNLFTLFWTLDLQFRIWMSVFPCSILIPNHSFDLFKTNMPSALTHKTIGLPSLTLCRAFHAIQRCWVCAGGLSRRAVDWQRGWDPDPACPVAVGIYPNCTVMTYVPNEYSVCVILMQSQGGEKYTIFQRGTWSFSVLPWRLPQHAPFNASHHVEQYCLLLRLQLGQGKKRPWLCNILILNVCN